MVSVDMLCQWSPVNSLTNILVALFPVALQFKPVDCITSHLSDQTVCAQLRRSHPAAGCLLLI
jgi:hypothetical protein